MNYDKAFSNLGRALSGGIDPTEVGKAPDARPREVDLSVGNPVDESFRHGTIAGRRSENLLDTKDHFPVITETQAQSSMARVLQLTEVPAWYKGTMAELRQEVYAGIVGMHPDIQLNVRVPVEQTVALSDGETPAQTSMQSIEDPADVAKNQVGKVSRPALTSAEVAEAMQDQDVRQAIAGRLMEMVDKQMESLQTAKKVATRLLKSGIKAEEFDQLSTYLQEDILRELISRGATASANAEDRRRELLERMSARQQGE